MSSDTLAVLRSIRRWSLTLVFLFGVALVALADIGYVITRYQDGLLFAIAGILGGGVSLVAGLIVCIDLLSGLGTAETHES